jgi:hypothetical protein
MRQKTMAAIPNASTASIGNKGQTATSQLWLPYHRAECIAGTAFASTAEAGDESIAAI